MRAAKKKSGGGCAKQGPGEKGEGKRGRTDLIV